MLVSVIIPSYNHAKYVIDALESIVNQTYRRIEIIVIDDGSTDESVKLIKSVKDSRLRLWVQENKGAHAAINFGLSKAQGDYLCIINSDDTFRLDRIEQCLRFINKKEIDFVCSWIRIIDENGKEKGIKKGWSNMRPVWSKNVFSNRFIEHEDFTLNLLSTNFVSTTSNMFFRRSVYDEVGEMRNLRFAHDWDYMLRIASIMPCSIIPEPLMNYRIHGKNTISSNKEWMLFEICWVLAANLFRFEGSTLFGKNCTSKDMQKLIKEISSSIYFEGYDRVFWMIRTFIESRRKVFGNNADEELLNDVTLRKAFISLIEAK